ncbi:competence protein CoiA [Methylomonas sp. LL1]|uniref:competence protein CoiA family protein n=1 Tax=Methylomonas sp. LL1 TaxID=2785785 RepID=UPI0018C39A66|nr:competence protein CoiA family protein [Methylomonas sp. LL1]QPK62914.1 competence protein CoiA [Methylomonas sp. LL1]
MSDFNKIPFGLREKDQQFVDVYSVKNGKQCGCICPSCGTPLEARQGDINVWHFAHSNKKVYDKTKNECEYSFYLSLRLMARQVLGTKIKLKLPAYKDNIEYFSGVFRYRQYKEFFVAPEQEITIENIAVESNFCDVPVDVIGSIGQFNFVIYFTHPDRIVPNELFHPNNDHCGVIEVRLDALSQQFMNAKVENKTYDDILLNFLSDDTVSKIWIYHPRYAIKKEQAIKELEQSSNIKIQTDDMHHTEPTNRLQSNYYTKPSVIEPIVNHSRIVQFKCILCKVEWQGHEAGGNLCPKCNSHLYSRMIETDT